MKTMGDRIRERLHELDKSQHWLAEKVGIRQPSLNKVINAKNGESTKHVVAMAQALNVVPDWLQFGTGRKLPDGERGPREAALVGYIGAGERVVRPEGGVVVQGGLEPPAGYERAIAARIRGNSMRPLEPGWLIFYEAEYDGDPDLHINRLCAVGLADGTTYIKKLRKRGNLYRLESWNADPIEDADVIWASPIIEIRPV